GRFCRFGWRLFTRPRIAARTLFGEWIVILPFSGRVESRNFQILGKRPVQARISVLNVPS
ncbi:MAG: hypothetical protein ACRBBU_06110, partial [Pseudooceanicola sp.]